jgi:hypothetical protein
MRTEQAQAYTRDPDGERRRDRELDEQICVLGGEIANRSRGERRGRCHRADDEVARTAESRIDKQRAGRRVEPDHR